MISETSLYNRNRTGQQKSGVTAEVSWCCRSSSFLVRYLRGGGGGSGGCGGSGGAGGG